jgi:orotate phosphoribosyltransferase
MNHNALEIICKTNSNLSISAIPGHFVTSHSHINYYIDITQMKHRHMMAMQAAASLSDVYTHNTVVDTIVCMDGSEVIGAFLARELSESGMMAVNNQKNIYVTTPEFNHNGQMIFRDNIQSMILKRNVLLLIASVTTGKTIHRCLECVNYYGGNVVGVCAIFSAKDAVDGVPIYSLFQAEDIPGYETYSFRDCPQCKAGVKIDALANSYGFSEL